MSTDAQQQSDGAAGRETPPLARRSFLHIAVVAAGGALLAACSGGSTSTGGATPAPTAPAATAAAKPTTAGATPATGATPAAGATPATGATPTTAAAVKPTAGGTIEITQWYHEYGEAGTQQAAQRYAQEYSQVKPNVTVKMVWTPGDYTAKLNAALLTAEGPDVFEGSPNLDMVRAGQITPLDDLFTPDIRQDFHPNDIASNSIEGKIYAVKMVDDTGMLYYRKSMLDKAGVKPPTTMDEVIAAAKQLATGRVKGLFVGNDGGISALLTIAPWSAGSDFLVDNKIVFNTPRTVAAWTKVRELNESNALLIGAPTDWWDPSALTQGLAAMQWTGLWAMPGIRKAINDDFGVLAWPAFDAEGKPATFWGGWAEMVSAKGKYVDEAKAFVKWLWIDNTKAQQDWNLSYGFHVPPRRSVAANAEPLKSGPAAQGVEFLYTNGRILSPLWTGAMNTAITTALSNIVKNKADAAAETATAAKKAEDELAKLLKG